MRVQRRIVFIGGPWDGRVCVTEPHVVASRVLVPVCDGGVVYEWCVDGGVGGDVARHHVYERVCVGGEPMVDGMGVRHGLAWCMVYQGVCE